MNKVRYYRLISGLLLKDLSEKTGLSVGHLSHIENGNKQPSKSAMESIALAVGSTVPEVFYTPLTAEEKEEMEHLGDEVDKWLSAYLTAQKHFRRSWLTTRKSRKSL